MSQWWKKLKFRSQLQKEPLNLNPKTAHPNLKISNDNKTVTFTKAVNHHDSNPKRFDTCMGVVTTQSFETGQHCWEVDVGRKVRWSLGVISYSAIRKGQLIKSDWYFWEKCLEGFWLLSWKEGVYKEWQPGRASTAIQGGNTPRKIRIYLNCDSGELTFYDASDDDNILHLSSLTVGVNERVYPFLDPSSCDHGKNPTGNSDPLTIC